MLKNFKTKARISITILPLTNSMLEKVSRRSGVSKSALVEKALKDYLRTQLEADAKALAKLSFDDLPPENDWPAIQSII